jgi:6-phosphogluconolactonase
MAARLESIQRVARANSARCTREAAITHTVLTTAQNKKPLTSGSANLNAINHNFDNSDLLAAALAKSVANDLHRGIAERGSALLAVSGGKTPTRFFHALAQQTLAWENIIVTLVDERWVAPSDERSNERLVRTELLQGLAAKARFVPLFEPGAATPEEGLLAVSTRILMLDLPFDALILGMGDDGHCASFFPGGDHLAEATDPKTDQVVVPMRAPGAGEPRITLTLPIVLESRTIYLHIETERKRRVLEHAAFVNESNRAFPISTVLRNSRPPLQVFWCP